MKVLTLTQPWATLVATRHKLIETRSWSTNYRGPLAIHAAKGFPSWARKMCHQVPFLGALGDYDFDPRTLPVGEIIATCELVDVIKIYADTETPGKPEMMFGDYSLGRYMWMLANIKKLDRPITAKGALGLWNFDMPTPEPKPA